jgi:hypothetical protein
LRHIAVATRLNDERFACRDLLSRNFHPYGYARLAREYPCMAVRASVELNAKTSSGLLELHPDHCLVEGIQVCTVGITCEKIRRAAQNE